MDKKWQNIYTRRQKLGTAYIFAKTICKKLYLTLKYVSVVKLCKNI